MDFGRRVGRIRVADQRNMTELVGIDVFSGRNGSGEEAEAILESGSPAVGRDLGLGRFESTLNQMVSSLLELSCIFQKVNFFFLLKCCYTS